MHVYVVCVCGGAVGGCGWYHGGPVGAAVPAAPSPVAACRSPRSGGVRRSRVGDSDSRTRRCAAAGPSGAGAKPHPGMGARLRPDPAPGSAGISGPAEHENSHPCGIYGTSLPKCSFFKKKKFLPGVPLKPGRRGRRGRAYTGVPGLRRHDPELPAVSPGAAPQSWEHSRPCPGLGTGIFREDPGKEPLPCGSGDRGVAGC